MPVLYNSNCLYEDKNGYKYSCDNIRIQGLLSDDEYCQKDFERYFNDPNNMRVSDVSTCLTKLKFKYLWTITCKNTTITVMHFFNGLTGKDDDRKKVVLDFNPNKLVYDDFVEIQKIVCNLVELKCVRMDLAIDLPIERKYANLLKGNKNYSYNDFNADGITEYTGVRNEVGFCKLYDKTIESKLDYPLTRFEITCKPDMIAFRRKLSKVIIEYENYQRELLEYERITKNMQVVISLLQDLDVQTRLRALKRFSKYQRQKISPYVLADTYELEIDYKCVQAVFDWVLNAVYFKQFIPNV